MGTSLKSVYETVEGRISKHICTIYRHLSKSTATNRVISLYLNLLTMGNMVGREQQTTRYRPSTIFVCSKIVHSAFLWW